MTLSEPKIDMWVTPNFIYNNEKNKVRIKCDFWKLLYLQRMSFWMDFRKIYYLFIYLFILITQATDGSDITDVGLHLECLPQISTQPSLVYSAEIRS